MSYRWATPLEWLQDKVAKAEDYQILGYLNAIIGDLDPDVIEEEHLNEMVSTGYFEQPDDFTAQDWLKLHIQDLAPRRQRQVLLDAAASLDSDALQNAFQSEMVADDYFVERPDANLV